MPAGREISRAQFDAVVRRAAELAARESEAGSDTRLTEAELYRIAGEVGLPEEHVRRALSEVRANPAEGSGTIDRIVGPRVVWASRIVRGSPDQLASRIDVFMTSGRLLQRVRRAPNRLQYRQAIDWVSKLARAASGASRKHYVASAKGVEVWVEAVDAESSLVTLVVDPGIRADYVGGAASVAVGGGAVGFGAGAAGWVLMPELAAVAVGAVTAGGVGWGLVRIVTSAYRRKLLDVQTEVEGILDQLEAGEPLEPPPPAWRKWVEEQFHGARRLLDPDAGDV